MSNFPQDKYDAPDISGKWKYWSNLQTLTSTPGVYSPIITLTGILDIAQNNLFFNYKNNEVDIYRLGALQPILSCENKKLKETWVGKSINNGENYTLTYNPYCYKNGKPLRMTSGAAGPGPYTSTAKVTPGVEVVYYERQ